MANIVPGVVWQPINVGNRAKRRKGRGLCGHVAVSSSKNLVPGPNADWHFYLPKVGPAIQYIDLDLQCRATGAGNATMAAFESEGGLGTTAQVNAEPWTENQLNWAARILRHMHDTEGVPLRVMNSSAPSERGFGTHRLGVPGYMAAGTEQWSSSRGKLCPGDAKHAQRAEIVRRAEGIGAAPTSIPIPLGDTAMWLAATPDKTVWKITDYEVTPESGIYRLGAIAKARGIKDIVQITVEELRDNQADAAARRAALLTDIAKAAGGDVDEDYVVAKVTPAVIAAVVDAVVGKTSITREDLTEALRGLTFKAS